MAKATRERRGPLFWLVGVPALAFLFLAVAWLVLRMTWDWRPVDYHERFRVRDAVMEPLVIEGVTFGEGEFELTLDMASRSDPFFGKFIVVTDPDAMSAEVLRRYIPSNWDESADYGTVVFTVRLTPPPQRGQTLRMELQSLYYSDAFTVQVP